MIIRRPYCRSLRRGPFEQRVGCVCPLTATIGSTEAVIDSSSRCDVQASPVSAYRNDREHMRVRPALIDLPILTSL